MPQIMKTQTGNRTFDVPDVGPTLFIVTSDPRILRMAAAALEMRRDVLELVYITLIDTLIYLAPN
jgi:hypothetical protein